MFIAVQFAKQLKIQVEVFIT